MKENTPKAIIFIILGMSIFMVSDTFIKLLSERTNLFLIYFFRSCIGLISITIFFALTNRNIILKTHYPFLTLLRTILFFCGFILYYFSLSKITLPLAVTLFFVSPFIITILSHYVFNEKIGIRRWSALLVGFIGVFLVMNPKFDNFNIYTTFPVICAACYAITMIIQKKTSDRDNLFSQLYHIYISALIFSSIAAYFTFHGSMANNLNQNIHFLLRSWNLNDNFIIFSLLIISFSAVIGFLFLFQAYRIGSPSSVAPFEYVMILWAILLGWLVFEETLNLRSYIGMLLIVLAGIYTFIREKKLKNKNKIENYIR